MRATTLKKIIHCMGYKILPTKYGEPIIICKKCQLPVAVFYVSTHRKLYTIRALLTYLFFSKCTDHRRMYRLVKSRWSSKAPLKIDREILKGELPDVLGIRNYTKPRYTKKLK